jgi:hypothetical protein
MMSKVKNILGWLWASPVTFFGIMYASLMMIFRYYRWVGKFDNSLVWYCEYDRLPMIFKKMWKKWSGHAIGNVIVMRSYPEENPTLLAHEQQHVRQVMRMGVFQPIFYMLIMIAIKWGTTNLEPYYDNPFELDARSESFKKRSELIN